MSERRRRKKPEKANHERWMISYADMLTLMLAVFVVLFASAEQNKAKLQEETASLFRAFMGHPPKLMQLPSTPEGPAHALPKAVKLPMQSMQHPVIRTPHPAPRRPQALIPSKVQQALQPELLAMSKLEAKLKTLLAPEVSAHRIQIFPRPLSVRIRLNANVLFATGNATLTKPAVTLLTPIAKYLAELPAGYLITVEGYTDDRPIKTAQFPSNWQLSTARAVSVVQLFRSQNVPGTALSAEGFSKYKPIASNDTAAGRSQNRRVEILVTAPKPVPADGASAKATPTAAAAAAAPPASTPAPRPGAAAAALAGAAPGDLVPAKAPAPATAPITGKPSQPASATATPPKQEKVTPHEP